MSNEVLKYSSFTLLFLLSLISFVVELSFIRILDAHYSITFSYIAITCALFGFSVAGFDIKEQNKKQMIFSVIVNLFLIAMSIQIANMFLIRNSIQWNKSLLNSIKSIGDIIFLLIALSSPFYFFGRINFLITKYYTKEISKIYFSDLLGAALGSILFYFSFSYLGPFKLLQLAFNMLTSLLFVILIFKLFSKNKKIKNVTLLFPLIALFASNFFYNDYINKDIIRPKVVSQKSKLELIKWDPISKIEVYANENKNFKTIVIDSGSQISKIFKFDGNYEKLNERILQGDYSDFWHPAVLAGHYLASEIKKDYSTLIIGAGGGQEVKAAQLFSAKKIEALEIIPTIIDLSKGTYSQYNGNIFNQDNTLLIKAEGRKFLTQNKEKKYDFIQLFSVHTSSSVSSGTSPIQTNYLNTVEAFELYYSRVSDNGIIQINNPLIEKIYITAKKAWQNLGRSDFENHVFVFGTDNPYDYLPTILINNHKWKKEEIDKLWSFIKNFKYNKQYPLKILFSPFEKNTSLYTTTSSSNYLIEIPTDNKPFFWWLKDNSTVKGNLNISNNLTSVTRRKAKLGRLDIFERFPTSLFHMNLITIFLIFVFLIYSIFIYKVQKQYSRNIFYIPLILFFSSIGFSFIIYELTFLQLGLRILGNPNQAYTVVLTTLLLGSGIGGLSLKYTNFLSNNRHLFLILFTALSLITFLLLFKTYIIWEFPSAVINLLFACLIFSQGFLMGNFFPFVIFKINQHKKLVSAAWISTAIFTTIGGHFSILFALKYGFTAVYLLGFFGYIVAFFLTKKLNAFASI